MKCVADMLDVQTKVEVLCSFQVRLNIRGEKSWSPVKINCKQTSKEATPLDHDIK